jgi:hypothetical protein
MSKHQAQKPSKQRGKNRKVSANTITKSRLIHHGTAHGRKRKAIIEKKKQSKADEARQKRLRKKHRERSMQKDKGFFKNVGNAIRRVFTGREKKK